MSRALPGMHYCKDHQGNHSHYDPKNCHQKIKDKKLVSSLYERLCVSCNYKWFALKTDTGMQPVTVKGYTIYYGGNHIQEEVGGQR